MKIAVSYLANENKKETIKKIDRSNADYIHVDLCDGKYVENKNFTMGEVENLLKDAQKPLDIHLMVNDPLKYIDRLALLNTEYITIHLNTCKDIEKTIDYIQSIGIKAGISLKIEEDLSLINDIISKIDYILIMSVEPGGGGRPFNEDVLSKLDELNSLKEKYHFEIGIDGGINNETSLLLKDKNLDIVVSGSFVTKSDDYNIAIDTLKKNIN